MATALSAAGAKCTKQQPCSRWLQESIAAARRALRRQEDISTGSLKDQTEGVPPPEDNIDWTSSCDFAGQEIKSQILIYASQRSFGVFSPRPVVPGHAIVCPRRSVKALFDLTKEEGDDLSVATQAVSWLLNTYYGSTASTIRLQQGAGARQTLSHMFVHVVPRAANDLPYNDDIYALLDEAVPVFDTVAMENKVSDALDEAQRGNATPSSDCRSDQVPQQKTTATAQQISGPINRQESRTLSPAELHQQSKEIRTWFLELALDRMHSVHACDHECAISAEGFHSSQQ